MNTLLIFGLVFSTIIIILLVVHMFDSKKFISKPILISILILNFGFYSLGLNTSFELFEMGSRALLGMVFYLFFGSIISLPFIINKESIIENLGMRKNILVLFGALTYFCLFIMIFKEFLIIRS